VDIFAPRHTPVVAASRAYVVFVGDDPTGGRVIWLKDSKRSLHIYYAHLQNQQVKQYTWVGPGQVIGRVGNTGNARSTPPHLHFGTYEIGHGAIDPYDYITQPKGERSPLAADLEALGHWMRVQGSPLNVNIPYGSASEQIKTLEPHSALKVLAAAGEDYRVLLPDGRFGYVPASQIEALNESLKNYAVPTDQFVIESPTADAAAIGSVNAGEGFSVLAKYEEYWLVKTQQGSTGWLQIPAAVSSDIWPE